MEIKNTKKEMEEINIDRLTGELIDICFKDTFKSIQIIEKIIVEPKNICNFKHQIGLIWCSSYSKKHSIHLLSLINNLNQNDISKNPDEKHQQSLIKSIIKLCKTIIKQLEKRKQYLIKQLIKYDIKN